MGAGPQGPPEGVKGGSQAAQKPQPPAQRVDRVSTAQEPAKRTLEALRWPITLADGRDQ